MDLMDDIGIKTTQYDVLKKAFGDLTDLLAGNAPVITPLANHLFAKSIIPNPVHATVINESKDPGSRATELMNAVLANLKPAGCDSNQLMSTFISELVNVGLCRMAKKLNDALRQHGFELDLRIPSNPTNTSCKQLKSKDEIETSIEELHSSFSILNNRITEAFNNSCSDADLQKIAQFTANHLKIPVSNLPSHSFKELFSHLKASYYDFINPELLKKLSIEFLDENNLELQHELFQYCLRLRQFSELSQLKHIKLAVKTPLDKDKDPLVLKFNTRWKNMTPSSIERVLERYFGVTAEFLKHCAYQFNSVIITLSAPASRSELLAQQLLDSISSMNRIGITEANLAGKCIFCKKDEMNFELSLAQSVKAGNSFEVCILLQLGADPKSTDMEKMKALLLATQCCENAKIIHSVTRNIIPYNLFNSSSPTSTGTEKRLSTYSIQAEIKGRNASASENFQDIYAIIGGITGGVIGVLMLGLRGLMENYFMNN